MKCNMSDHLKKYSFSDLISMGNIRIPRIQRDYAQGRRNDKVDEIRKLFVHSLALVVKGKRPAAELDFVYGSDRDNAFEPLDGQQRLTTLFLLHWLLGASLSRPDDSKRSTFTYETRNTSQEFCDELVGHDALSLIMEARNKEKAPSDIIRERDWFKWEWKYDPTVISMLVMIDALSEEMGPELSARREDYLSNLEKITFNLLNLGDFGLSDELFIKMNARGKQLSSFDKLKSTLEEELQLQQKEKDFNGKPLADESVEEKWRTLMDGAWIDFLWHKYASPVMSETHGLSPEDSKAARLQAARHTEHQFKKLLLRLIALQLFERDILPDRLAEVVYDIDEGNLDGILFEYSDSLSSLRSEENHLNFPQGVATIDFNRLMQDMNLLIYKDSRGVFHEVSSLLPPTSHIEKDERTVLDSFLEGKVANDVELIFYSMLLFLRIFPARSNSGATVAEEDWFLDESQLEAWRRNFQVWVTALRNILLNDNNNQRIDKLRIAREATLSLKSMAADLDDFVSKNDLDMDTDPNAVRKFFSSLDKTYSRIDNHSLEEEKVKSNLILKGGEGWEKALLAAESHPYLWGQVRSPLNWAGDDLSKFNEYSTRLLQLLDLISSDGLLYYTAVLTFNPRCWEENNRLFLYNRDRDNSFKRHMREHRKENEAYGVVMKALIDEWISKYESSDASGFLRTLIKNHKDAAPEWVKCVVKIPAILDQSWQKRVFSQNGHTVLAQRKTRDSHCFDPIFLYFDYLCREKKIDSKEFRFFDSKGEREHAFEITRDGKRYLAEWAPVGDDFPECAYHLSIDGVPEKAPFSPSELVRRMESVIRS